MQSENNNKNLKTFPFSKQMIESFAGIMKGLGFPIESITEEVFSKAFSDNKLYDKMIELLNMRKEIVETQLEAVKAMFLYHHFGGDTFIVNHRIIGKNIEVKIEGYDTEKNQVVIFAENSRASKRYSISRSDFEDIIVKRVETIK